MDLRIVIPPRYKDLFQDNDTMTIEELFVTIEDLNSEIDKLQEEYDKYKENVNDNYRFVGMSEQVGIDNSDFLEDR